MTLIKEFNGNNSGEKITNPATIADWYNEYFLNIGPGIKSLIPKKRLIDISLIVVKIVFIRPVANYKYELENAIHNLNSKKALDMMV